MATKMRRASLGMHTPEVQHREHGHPPCAWPMVRTSCKLTKSVNIACKPTVRKAAHLIEQLSGVGKAPQCDNESAELTEKNRQSEGANLDLGYYIGHKIRNFLLAPKDELIKPQSSRKP